MRTFGMFVAVTLTMSACGGSAGADVTSQDVVAAFQEAGLEAENSRPMTREDFGIAPMKTDDATRFLIPSLGDDAGGRAFVFEDTADLADTKEFYEALGRESAILFSWVFANEDLGVLVQINGDLPEETAREYAAIIEDL